MTFPELQPGDPARLPRTKVAEIAFGEFFDKGVYRIRQNILQIDSRFVYSLTQSPQETPREEFQFLFCGECLADRGRSYG
jgi:hypothetical protein